ncbi:MAG TPA: DUF4097 family beta strand repeat-containing protein [Streptosporangiaceae bacterium]|nr:DUF4097 family beta strand repeat-containing protein [Streptosporangiaceae bacterium]
MTLTSAAGASRARGNLRMTPGRWVAVALAVPVALALIGWTGFSFVGLFARGSYPFSYPVQVHDGQVAVHVTSGNVTLQQASAGSARLTGTVQYDLVRPGLSESMAASVLDVGVVNCLGVGSGCGLNAALDVPARTGVELWSDGGDISVSGFTSPLTLWAQGGNMTASNLAGDLSLDTGGGDLTGSGLTGNVQVSAEGGNINVGDVAGTVRLDTGGGDLAGNGFSGPLQLFAEGGNISLNAVASQQVNAQSGGGDVSLVFTQVPTDLQITAAGGNVTVILPPGGTTYDIRTQTDGGNVSYPAALASSSSPDTITIDSGGGDITIAQAG